MNSLITAAGVVELGEIGLGPVKADFHLVPSTPATRVCVPLPAVRLDQVQAFLVLAEELHFRKAGERLFISQSGVTRRVAALEAALGQPLLERSTRSVRLTRAGWTFLPLALDLVDQVRRSAAALQSPAP